MLTVAAGYRQGAHGPQAAKPRLLCRPSRSNDGRIKIDVLVTSTKRKPMTAIDYFTRTDTVHIATELRDGGEVVTPIWAVVVDGVPYIRNGYGGLSHFLLAGRPRRGTVPTD